MTQTAQQSPSLILSKSDRYDVANSLLVLRVYFKYQWKDSQGRLNNSIPYYLKFNKETAYEQYNTEFARAFERLNEILGSDNPFKTAILYQNYNKGKMVAGVQNPEVFKIVDSKGTLNLTLSTDSDNVIEYVKENFEALRQKYHGKI